MTIPQDEGDPKVKTKSVVLLGERKGEGAKAGFPNGDIYEGAYFGGLRHGVGKYAYAAQPPAAEGEDPLPPAGSYDGTWKKHKKSGLGVMAYAGGAKYNGMWHNGMRSGQGAFYYANGDIYSGEWKEGKKDGTGTYFCKASGSKLVGHYEKGALVEGTFTDSFGATFTGTFVDGSYGAGAWKLASGATA